MMDPKELEQLVELGKNAALLVGIVAASAIGAWKSIRVQLRPITKELSIDNPPETQSTLNYNLEDSPTLKATAVRIEDRVKGLEDSLKQVISTQDVWAGRADQLDHQLGHFSGQISRFGDQLNLLQEQVNTIHRHLLNNGRPH